MAKMRNLITNLHGRFNCLTGNIQVAFTLKRIFWMFFIHPLNTESTTLDEFCK